MDRPWEEARHSTASSGPTGGRQSLPSLSEMASGVPAMGRLEDSPTSRGINSVRDSGNWSMQSPSKHSSVMSSSTNGIQLPSLNSSHTSPNGHLSASSDRSPFSATFPNGISSGPMDHAPSSLSQINRTYEPGSHAHLRLSNECPPIDSRLENRRSSVDARMNNLALASPLPSTNASQTSLVSDLQRERGIPTDTPRSSGFSVGSSHSRVPEKLVTTSIGRKVGSKIAPPINAHPRTQWPNPNAENPTKGFPYAFPDPELATNNSTTTTSPEDDTAASHPTRSRRNSIGALSVTSSVFTNDSRMVHGGRSDMTATNDYPKDEFGHHTSYFNDRCSTDFTTSINHHHHQLHNKQLDGLMDDDDDPESPNGQTPYSRTPELRVSHKLAERKRRSEMKGLFEELRSKLPADGRVSKTSKWEILTKAIEYIKMLEISHVNAKQTAELYRREMDRNFLLERELQAAKDELKSVRQKHHTPGSTNLLSQYHQRSTPQTGASSMSATPRPTLPGLGPSNSAGAMQGIQYST